MLKPKPPRTCSFPALGPRRSGVQPWSPRAPCWILPAERRGKALTLKGWCESAWAPKRVLPGALQCCWEMLSWGAGEGCLTKTFEFSLGIPSLRPHENTIGPPYSNRSGQFVGHWFPVPGIHQGTTLSASQSSQLVSTIALARKLPSYFPGPGRERLLLQACPCLSLRYQRGL